MNWTTIKNKIYDWITLEGETAIWLNGNGPQPSSNYFGMQIINNQPIGWDYVTPEINASDEIEIIGNRDFVVNIHYYGADAFLKVDDKVNSLESPTTQAFLRESDFVYVNKGTTTDGPILYDSDYKEHALNTITFRAANVIAESFDYFNTVSIDGTIKEQDAVKRTVNINVNI